MDKEQIQTHLKRLGLTYANVAEELGVTIPTIQKIVDGDTTRGTSRYAFAKAVGLEVEDLWPAGEATP